MANDIKWNLLILKPKGGSTGPAILKIIRVLVEIISYRFVVIDYVFGATQDGLITRLQEKENKPIYLSDLLSVLDQVNQFDWCDFFLFEEKPLNWLGEEDILYPPLVAQTDTTVRAVDGTYIYIYTQYDAIVSAINKNYEIESITTDTLENLPFPE